MNELVCRLNYYHLIFCVHAFNRMITSIFRNYCISLMFLVAWRFICFSSISKKYSFTKKCSWFMKYFSDARFQQVRKIQIFQILVYDGFSHDGLHTDFTYVPYKKHFSTKQKFTNVFFNQKYDIRLTTETRFRAALSLTVLILFPVICREIYIFLPTTFLSNSNTHTTVYQHSPPPTQQQTVKQWHTQRTTSTTSKLNNVLNVTIPVFSAFWMVYMYHCRCHNLTIKHSSCAMNRCERRCFTQHETFSILQSI